MAEEVTAALMVEEVVVASVVEEEVTVALVAEEATVARLVQKVAVVSVAEEATVVLLVQMVTVASAAIAAAGDAAWEAMGTADEVVAAWESSQAYRAKSAVASTDPRAAVACADTGVTVGELDVAMLGLMVAEAAGCSHTSCRRCIRAGSLPCMAHASSHMKEGERGC